MKNHYINFALCLMALCAGPAASLAQDNREPDLSTIAPVWTRGTNKVAMVGFAVGVQIYRWNGSAWVFRRTRGGTRMPMRIMMAVALHYAGRRGKHSGSKVVWSPRRGLHA